MPEFGRESGEGEYAAEMVDGWLKKKPSERPREIFPVERQHKEVTLAGLIHESSLHGAIQYIRRHPILWGVGAALGLATMTLIAQDEKSKNSGDINFIFIDSDLFEH